MVQKCKWSFAYNWNLERRFGRAEELKGDHLLPLNFTTTTGRVGSCGRRRNLVPPVSKFKGRAIWNTLKYRSIFWEQALKILILERAPGSRDKPWFSDPWKKNQFKRGAVFRMQTIFYSKAVFITKRISKNGFLPSSQVFLQTKVDPLSLYVKTKEVKGLKPAVDWWLNSEKYIINSPQLLSYEGKTIRKQCSHVFPIWCPILR